MAKLLINLIDGEEATEINSFMRAQVGEKWLSLGMVAYARSILDRMESSIMDSFNEDQEDAE